MITSFATLKSAIADFLVRDDLTDVIPTFISFAEARIDRELTHWRQELRSEAALDAQYMTLPTDFLRPIRLQITDTPSSEVKPISTAQMMQMRQDRGDVGGRPQYYAITATSLELFPTPDDTYNASLVYYGRISALSDTNTTNWLLSEAPDVYLYGSLIHSAPYLKDDARVAVWEALFAQGLANLNTSADAARWGGSGLTMKTRRGAP